MALPAETSSTGTSISGSNGPLLEGSAHKFYTFTVDLRETYDDNVNTSGSNKQASEETTLSPSILVDFPIENTEISAGYTFGLTYYSNTAGTGQNLQYTNSFDAQVRHDFSERLSLNASDSLLDSTEPNIFGTTGTPYRNGQNISNAFSSGASMQWTPLVGSQTTYGNTLVRYLDNPSISAAEDSLENTLSETVSFTVVPTISVNLGGIFDEIAYDSNPRGYTSYTGFVGGTWQALPNVTTSLRAGGSYTQSKQLLPSGQATNTATTSPYVDLSGSWQIGQRSSLTGDYSHEVTPSDYFGSNGQISDRFSANFNYLITPQLTSHVQVTYTNGDITGGLIYSSGLSSYTEVTYGADAGLSYNFVKYFSLTFDISLSGVSSGLPDSSYTRDQVTFGLRGTY